MSSRGMSLDDKFTAESGRVLLSGIDALVRLPMEQIRRDRQAGLDSAGFISGYRGSPLGAYDQRLAKAKALLDQHDIHVQPGVNEDLAATAVWGSQQVNLHPGAKKDGVFGLWYGKAPGVDRSGDVFKHANMTGTWPKGGVLAIAGDDPLAKSSSLPSQSEFAFVDAEMPVLTPADIQDVLDLGLHGIAMSRFSGLWTGMIALAELMDGSATLSADPDRLRIHLPPDDMAPRHISLDGAAGAEPGGAGRDAAHEAAAGRPSLCAQEPAEPGDGGQPGRRASASPPAARTGRPCSPRSICSASIFAMPTASAFG